MKSQIFSLSIALAFSFIHFLMELWRGFLDFSFVFPQEFSRGSTTLVGIFALLYTLVFAIWLLGLRNAQQGKKGGVITALLIGALFWVGIDLGTIFLYCPGGCSEAMFNIGTYAALIVGAMALVSLAANLRQSQTLTKRPAEHLRDSQEVL